MAYLRRPEIMCLVISGLFCITKRPLQLKGGEAYSMRICRMRIKEKLLLHNQECGLEIAQRKQKEDIRNGE